MSLEDFENKLLERHVEWFKNATHEEREDYLQQRVDDLSPGAYAVYFRFCVARGVKPREQSAKGKSKNNKETEMNNPNNRKPARSQEHEQEQEQEQATDGIVLVTSLDDFIDWAKRHGWIPIFQSSNSSGYCTPAGASVTVLFGEDGMVQDVRSWVCQEMEETI